MSGGRTATIVVAAVIVVVATLVGGLAAGLVALGLVAAAAFIGRSAGDAASVLAVFVALLLLVPAALTLAAGGGLATPATLCGLVAAMLWFAGRMSGASSTEPVSLGVRLALLGFGTVVLVSYAGAVLEARVPVEARGADRGVVVMVALVGVALLASEAIPSRERLEFVLRVAVVAAAIAAVVAILQFAFRLDVTKDVAIPGFTRHDTGYEAITRRAHFNRVAGTALHPIELSAALVMLLPIALHFVYVTRRWFWTLAALLIAAAVPLSISRTGGVALVTVAIMLFPAWPSEFRRRVTAGVLILATMVSLAAPGLLSTIWSLFAKAGSDNSVTAREEDWATFGRFFAHRPIFGRGFGTFIPPRFPVFDNQYLLSLVELGVVGTFALVVVFVVGFRTARAARRAARDPGDRDLAQALAASIAVALVACATFDLLSFPLARGVAFLLIGCTGALLRFQRRAPTEEPSRAAIRGRRVAVRS